MTEIEHLNAASTDVSTQAPTTAPTNTCPRCGTGFSCGMAAGATRCWCVEYPPAFAVPAADAADAACYCPACLAELVASRQRARG